MDIGKRLRELREASGLSQSDIEGRTGLVLSNISQVESGEMMPTLPVLEGWAKALEIELYQVFIGPHEKPEAPKLPKLGAQDRTLLALFSQMPSDDKTLLISLAREMVKRTGQRE